MVTPPPPVISLKCLSKQKHRQIHRIRVLILRWSGVHWGYDNVK